jgi:hypothetical protein
MLFIVFSPLILIVYWFMYPLVILLFIAFAYTTYYYAYLLSLN